MVATPYTTLTLCTSTRMYVDDPVIEINRVSPSLTQRKGFEVGTCMEYNTPKWEHRWFEPQRYKYHTVPVRVICRIPTGK